MAGLKKWPAKGPWAHRVRPIGSGAVGGAKGAQWVGGPKGEALKAPLG